MNYASIEGLGKKDAFKKNFIKLVVKTGKNLLTQRLAIVPESLGEPAALIDFLDYDFCLAFKTDGVGTKSLIADRMAHDPRCSKFGIKLLRLYRGLGIDLVASNVNDLICVGATPIAISDEIAAGDYHAFTNQSLVDGLYQGLLNGCREAGITIPSGESPTLVDVLKKDVISLTASSIGIVKPKQNAILGQKLQAGDGIYGLASSGMHTNGLALARKIVEKLPDGYFTGFGHKTIGEVLLTPTAMYVKPVLAMLQHKINIHYMTHISGSAFRKIMRAKHEFTYVIEKLPAVPSIMRFLIKSGTIPLYEAYQTWNMGIGFVLFAPPSEENTIKNICKQFHTRLTKLGYVKNGARQVILQPINHTYS